MKQTFRLGNYRFLKLLCSFTSLILVVFGFLIVVPPVPTYNPVQAEDGPVLSATSATNASISMSVGNSISLNATPNSSFMSSAIVPSVTTNNYTGYVLTSNLSGTNSDLSHTTPGASATIPSISANYATSNFPTNYWGVSTDNTTYKPLPTSSNTPLTIKTNTSAATNQSSNLYIGTKISSAQTSGTYTNTIILTSVVNPVSYKITYNKNTTDTVTNLPAVKEGQVSNNAETLSPNVLARTGYTFLGWSESSTATAATYAAGSTFYFDATKNNSNINLYAVWKINTYTVTINSNNTGYGSVNHASLSNVPYGATVTTNSNTITINGTTTTATHTTNTSQYSYSFSSWTNGCGGTITGSCTITANFDRVTNQYTVTWNANGGSVSPTTTTKNYGSQIGTLPTPTRDALYTFQGWYTAQSGGTQISTSTTITANVTYYAHWISPIQVTIYASGGYGSHGTTSPAPGTYSFKYGTSVNTSNHSSITIGSQTFTQVGDGYSEGVYDWFELLYTIHVHFNNYSSTCGSTLTSNCSVTFNFSYEAEYPEIIPAEAEEGDPSGGGGPEVMDDCWMWGTCGGDIEPAIAG